MPLKKLKIEDMSDPELQEARRNALLDMLGRSPMKKPIVSGRNLTKPQSMAIEMLMGGKAFEVLVDSMEFGDDKVDPATLQVRPYEKQKRFMISQEVYPEEKGWIEHILKALQGVPLKRVELDEIKKHIKRLNYEGALRDMYEFYGMTIKELREKEKELRTQGSIGEADRLRTLLVKVDKKLKKNVGKRRKIG